MLKDVCFQDLGDSVPQPYHNEVTSMVGGNNLFVETTTMSEDRQQDVWGGSLFSPTELGTELQSEPNLYNTCGISSNGNIQTAHSNFGNLTQVAASDEHRMSLLADFKSITAPTLNPHSASSGSSFRQKSVLTSSKNGATSSLVPYSMVYTPQTNQPSISSFMSAGNATMLPNRNINNNNNMTYQQASQVSSTLPVGLPTFFTTAQTCSNVLMFAPSPSPQQLCVPAASPNMIPYYFFAPSHQALDVNDAMAYSSLTAAPQTMGAVMCNPWPPSAVSAAGTAASNPAGVPTTFSAMSQVFAATNATTTSQPVFNFASGDSNQGSVTSPTIPAGSESNNVNQKAPPKGSPPSYDSLRLRLTKRRQPPGRQRSGTNVHGRLQGGCAYYSYNLSAALKQYEQPDLQPTRHDEQVLPIFIQMFPCELRDRTIIVLNRVVEATCGLGVATVVGIEPRSETSFIALVRTNKVWLLIHRLRCRVLMDRHGFWYGENMEQYLRLKEYCESVRRLPQQMRHLQTDGLPCMPLVVELSRSVNPAAVTSPPAAPSFDELVPIVTVDRHMRPSVGAGCSREKSLPMDEDDEENRAMSDSLVNGEE